jgi:hypothetical protein
MVRKRQLERTSDVDVEALLDAIRRDIVSKQTIERSASLPQTFGFENCVDLYWKLYWEIACLQHVSPHNIIDMKCFALNAAITAWHLTEWVFIDMTPVQRERHRIRSLIEFQNFARKHCRALHLCRQIATASKHRTVTLHADRGVTTDFGLTPLSQSEEQFGTNWEIVIKDGAATLLAINVLEEARSYWYRFISDLELGID